MRQHPTLHANRLRRPARARVAATALALITLALVAGCGSKSHSTVTPPTSTPSSSNGLIAIFTHDGGDEIDWRGTFTDFENNRVDFDSVTANPAVIKVNGGTMSANGTSVGEWTMTFDPPVAADQITALPDTADQDSVQVEAGDDPGQVLVHVRDSNSQPANLSFTLREAGK